MPSLIEWTPPTLFSFLFNSPDSVLSALNRVVSIPRLFDPDLLLSPSFSRLVGDITLRSLPFTRAAGWLLMYRSSD